MLAYAYLFILLCCNAQAVVIAIPDTDGVSRIEAEEEFAASVLYTEEELERQFRRRPTVRVQFLCYCK